MEIDKEWKPTAKAPLPAARKRPSRSSAHRSWKEDEYEFLDDDDHPQMGRVVPYRKHFKESTSMPGQYATLSNVIVISDSDDDTSLKVFPPVSTLSSQRSCQMLEEENAKLNTKVKEFEKALASEKALREQQLYDNLKTATDLNKDHSLGLDLSNEEYVSATRLKQIIELVHRNEKQDLLKELTNAKDMCRTLEEASRDAASEALKSWEQERATLRALSLYVPQYDRYSRYQLETLDKTDPAFEFISDYFTQRVNKHRHPRTKEYGEPPKLEVKSIRRVHNPRLWAKYRAEVDDIWGLCEGRARSLNDGLLSAQSMNMAERTNRINEYFLFHGLPHNLAHQIAMQGFDERYAGEHFGALFGKGVYFAETPSKSDIYTSTDASNERFMFLSRVCLGETYDTRQAMQNIWKPPMRDDKRGLCNSVRAMKQTDGGCVEYIEYIIYKGVQAYPEYLIMYAHAVGCKCTHCS